jgi:3-hydroxyisobutyrate dehydrogenase-like beta-hydroxyacid dehydrogenase
VNFEILSLSKTYILTAMLYAQKGGLAVEKTLELEVVSSGAAGSWSLSLSKGKWLLLSNFDTEIFP